MRHRIVTLQVPQPAAGAGFTFVPSTTDKTLLLALTGKLATDATVASRRPALTLADQAGLTYWTADAVFGQAASLAVIYSWARGAALAPAAALVTAERVALPLPWLRLQPGDEVTVSTTAEDTGDQWSAIVYRAIVGDWWEHEEELAALAQALAIGAAG